MYGLGLHLKCTTASPLQISKLRHCLWTLLDYRVCKVFYCLFAWKDLVVLEAASGGLITVMADDGFIKSTISPAQLDGCGRLQSPSAIAVDSAHNIVVSESGRGARVLLFGANGRLQRVLHGPSSPAARVTEPQSSETGPWPAALAVGPDDRLYVIMREEKFAEIRVYDYLWLYRPYNVRCTTGWTKKPDCF